VVRAVETIIGIPVPGRKYKSGTTNLAAAFVQAANSPQFNQDVQMALKTAVPILKQLAAQLGVDALTDFSSAFGYSRDLLVTTLVSVPFFLQLETQSISSSVRFMDISWFVSPSRLQFKSQGFTGSTITPPTQRMPPWDPRFMTITCIIRTYYRRLQTISV
jgi:hypothetical protein